jgi:hypothetical protein
MSVCPICDFPETNDLRAILDRIENTGGGDLIVNLACDFAERIIDVTPRSDSSYKWLLAARRCGGARISASKALSAAWVAAEAATGTASNAAWAVWHAVGTAETPTGAKAINAAADAALAAQYLPGGSSDSEQEWQLEHTRKLACICSILVPTPLDARSRNSLLAS